MTEQLRTCTFLTGFGPVGSPWGPPCGETEFRTRTHCDSESRCEFAKKLPFRRHLFRLARTVGLWDSYVLLPILTNLFDAITAMARRSIPTVLLDHVS